MERDIIQSVLLLPDGAENLDVDDHRRLVVLTAEVAVAGAEARVNQRDHRGEGEEGTNSIDEHHGDGGGVMLVPCA